MARFCIDFLWLDHTWIMPQTKVEKKFSSVIVGKTQHHLASIICQKPGLAGFQQFAQNLTGGAE